MFFDLKRSFQSQKPYKFLLLLGAMKPGVLAQAPNMVKMQEITRALKDAHRTYRELISEFPDSIDEFLSKLIKSAVPFVKESCLETDNRKYGEWTMHVQNVACYVGRVDEAAFGKVSNILSSAWNIALEYREARYGRVILSDSPTKRR